MSITNEEIIRRYAEESASLRKLSAEVYEALIRAQDELADLRAYKERTEAGLVAMCRAFTNQGDRVDGLSARVVQMAQGTVRHHGLWRDPPEATR